MNKIGHEVIETCDGSEAWSVMTGSGAPRLAILDWMMPRMDGLEVVRRIRALDVDNPPYIIMLTSRGDKNDIVTGLDAGADDYLTKPFHADELRVRIDVGKRILDMQTRLASRIEELSLAVEHIKTLQGILPICSFCKKIRNDKGYWDQVEAYIGQHSRATFSHSICPECLEEHYPEFAEDEVDDSVAE